MKTRIAVFPVAGLKYYAAMSMADMTLKDEPLEVFPEPTNPHDPLALELWYRDEKVGYVPKPVNQIMLSGGQVFGGSHPYSITINRVGTFELALWLDPDLLSESSHAPSENA